MNKNETIHDRKNIIDALNNNHLKKDKSVLTSRRVKAKKIDL